jgi:hypothetical protein
MKVLLSISERIVLASSALPPESDFVTLKLVRKIKDQIGFSDEELREFEISSDQTEGGITRFKWNTSKERSIEFEFGQKSVEVIKQSLDTLANKKKANEQHLDLWEKFNKEEVA